MRADRPTFVIHLAAAVFGLAGVATAKPSRTEAVAPDDLVRGASPAPAAPTAVVGAPAPDFELRDTDGREHRLSDYVAQGKTVVLEWFNPECPFVRKHHEKYRTMVDAYAKYRSKDVVWLAINSAAPGKQGYGLERNQEAKRKFGMEYPLLLDESGSVGRSYGAKTTPHMFVISKGNLVYAGAIDDNPSPGTLGATNHVAKALDEVLAGKPVQTAQTKSYGCSVKYGAAVP
jgi:peroxiredoxin